MLNSCDIIMAIERFLAIRLSEETPHILEKHRMEQKKGVIPCLLTPPYILGLLI